MYAHYLNLLSADRVPTFQSLLKLLILPQDLGPTRKDAVLEATNEEVVIADLEAAATNHPFPSLEHQSPLRQIPSMRGR